MSHSMSIVINTQGFTVTPALRAFVNRRLELALDRFSDRIINLEVFMKDLNGYGKGGEDQSVLVSVSLRGLSKVITETVTDDLYRSVSIAARRTRRSVQRTLKRYDRIERNGASRLCLPPSGTVEAL